MSSLRRRQFFILILALAPSLAFAVLLMGMIADSSRRSQIADFETSVLKAVDGQRSALQRVRQALRLSAIAVAKEFEATSDCKTAIASLIENHSWSTRAAIFDETGVASCGASRPISLEGRDYWARFQDSQHFTLSGVLVGRLSGKTVVTALSPINSGREDLHAIGVGIDFDYLSLAGDEAAPDAVFALFGADGVAITSSTEAKDAGETWLPENLADRLQFGDRQFEGSGLDGAARTYFVSEITEGELWVVAALPEPTLWDMASFEIIGVFALPIMGCVFAVGAVAIATRRLIAPHFSRLTEIARTFSAGGDVGAYRPSETAPEEIAALERTLIEMGKTLKNRNDELASAVGLQRRLLMEVHHRVKNNLQTVSSLVSIEARRVRNDAAKTSLRTIQERLNSLSLVHRSLYSSADIDSVDLGQLVREIAEQMNKTLSQTPEATTPHLELQSIFVGTVEATPIALCVTEAIANAYKHGATSPALSVSLKSDAHTFELRVANRSSEVRSHPSSGSSIGQELMKGFAKQIGGRLDVDYVDGEYSISLAGPVRRSAPLFDIGTSNKAAA